MTQYSIEHPEQSQVQSSREALQSISANRKLVLERIERLTKKIGGIDTITLPKHQKPNEYTFTRTQEVLSSRKSDDVLSYFLQPPQGQYSPPAITSLHPSPIIQIQSIVPKRIVKNRPYQEQTPIKPHILPPTFSKTQSTSHLARTVSPKTRAIENDPVSQVLQTIRSALVKSKTNVDLDHQLARDIDSLQRRINKVTRILTDPNTLY